jgi:hypothetical protein
MCLGEPPDAFEGEEMNWVDGKQKTATTVRGTSETIPPQVLETMVELVGIEPTTSSLRTMRSPS